MQKTLTASLLSVRPYSKEFPDYDSKKSDNEAPVIQEPLSNAAYHFITIAHRSTLTRSGSTW